MKVFICEVKYDAAPEIRVMSRTAFVFRKRNKRKGIVFREATKDDEAEVREYHNATFREWYDEQIAKKYNMPLNWRENRWFVEQVRPHL